MAGLSYENHKKQYESILNAIKGGTEPTVNGRDSLQSLAVVEALYLSAEKGEPVDIDEVLGTYDK
jgi:UDP-N-acetyl-2-amino-2-deoxyglucuronate dehydrogenase